jgi:phosphoribosylformylglycinamidine synthase
VAVLDNFCWGNPDKPDRLGSLVRAAFGCYDAAKAFGVPFISGKDSLYNEYSLHGRSQAIPGTLLISAIGVMGDVSRAVSMDAKDAGNLVYALGLTRGELGGSRYYALSGAIGSSVPKVDFKGALKLFNALSLAAARGLARSIHDCSEGGLGVALAEMAFAGGLGMEVFLSEVPFEDKFQIPNSKSQINSKFQIPNKRNDVILFSESNSRFVVEVEKKKQKEFEQAMRGVPLGLIGCLSAEKKFKVHGVDGALCLNAGIDRLKAEWRRPLQW